MKFTPPKTISRTEVLLLGLTLATALIMAWQYWGMNSLLVIEPSHGSRAWAVNDETSNGNSEASFNEDDAYHLHCKLNYTIRYPHCSLLIELSSQNGLDLTRYENLHLTLSQTSNPRDSLQVYLKHMSSTSDIETPTNQTSVNLLVINPTPTLQEYILPLKNFYVPSWWVYMSNLPHETPGPDLTQINYLVITTGDNDSERNVDMSITRIEFSGKWIAAADLYKILLGTWIFIFATYYFYQLIQLHIESREQKMTALELEEINTALNIRRKHLEAMTIYDQATGLLNRRGILELLQTNLHKKTSSQQDFLVLIRFSNIKKIATQLAHENTDSIMSSLARQLAPQINLNCTMAVWSTNELLVFCSNTHVETAEQLAKHIHHSLAEITSLNEHVIQYSIGLTEFTQHLLETNLSPLENALSKTQETTNILIITTQGSV